MGNTRWVGGGGWWLKYNNHENQAHRILSVSRSKKQRRFVLLHFGAVVLSLRYQTMGRPALSRTHSPDHPGSFVPGMNYGGIRPRGEAINRDKQGGEAADGLRERRAK